MSDKKEVVLQKRSLFEKFIRAIEVIGNKFPHPFWLFVVLSVILFALSYWLAGKEVTYMVSKAGKITEQTVAVANLVSYESIRTFFAGFVKTYVNFAPLGLILTMMLGIGLVEQTGMISALMRKTILGAPRALVTAVIALVGINANLASDAGIIFTPVIAGAVFKALGRNPWRRVHSKPVHCGNRRAPLRNNDDSNRGSAVHSRGDTNSPAD